MAQTSWKCLNEKCLSQVNINLEGDGIEDVKLGHYKIQYILSGYQTNDVNEIALKGYYGYKLKSASCLHINRGRRVNGKDRANYVEQSSCHFLLAPH